MTKNTYFAMTCDVCTINQTRPLQKEIFTNTLDPKIKSGFLSLSWSVIYTVRWGLACQDAEVLFH